MKKIKKKSVYHTSLSLNENDVEELEKINNINIIDIFRIGMKEINKGEDKNENDKEVNS